MSEQEFALARLNVRPGDVIVVRCDRPVSMAAADRMRSQVERAFPGHRAMILDHGLTLETAGEPDPLTPEMVSRIDAAWQTQVIGDGPGVPLQGLATLTDAHPSATEAPQSAQDVAEAPESHHDRDEGWEAEK